MTKKTTQVTSGESQDTNSKEPKVDPKKVIKVPPQMINESLEIPDKRPQISSEDTGSKN